MPLPGVIGRRGGAPREIRRAEELSANTAPGANPGPFGVPIGVPLDGMLGSGGVPAYCARNTRGLGEAEMGMERLGEPLKVIGNSGLGLLMLTGLDGVGIGTLDGDDMVVEDKKDMLRY